MANDKRIAVGIVGLGRSGWGLHANAFMHPAAAEKYRVVAVSDPIAARADEAKQAFGCRTYAGIDELLADKEVELVTVATYNYEHGPHSIAALEAGKHVICEKPMATSAAEADRMIAAAKKAGRVLTINHNMRFTPFVQKVRQVLDSGILGEVILIKASGHSFRRRWDWQTLKKYAGGEMNNNASHSVDMCLQLMGEGDPRVSADLRRTPGCAGDAEDHVKITLYMPNGPTADIEVSNAAAIPAESFLLMGTQGGMAGNYGKLRWRFFDPKLLQSRQPSGDPTPDRSYNREEIGWQEESWESGKEVASSYTALYLDLYETIRNGKPLAITPESVRRVVAVLDECRRQSPLYGGGR